MPILASPHKAEIDNLLFDLRRPVTRVHTWLLEHHGVTSITYMMLVRYKNARNAKSGSDDGELRRKAVLKDLAYLERVVRQGKAALDAGVLARPNEVIRAIELRAHLLALFPDASAQREKAIENTLERTIAIVNSVITEEQRQQIVKLIMEQDDSVEPKSS